MVADNQRKRCFDQAVRVNRYPPGQRFPRLHTTTTGGGSLVNVVIVVLLLVVLLAVILLLVRSNAGDASVFQQQLIELRARMDALVEAQRALPAAVGAGTLEQTRTMADLRERLAHLTEATHRLEVLGHSITEVQDLLKVPKLRGTLGEIWLEELLRQIFPASLYHTQYAFRSGERVDAVLRIGARLVPIDSKFPLEACQRMVAATANVERERSLFRRTLKNRIDEVASKYIRPEEGTYDFALMYVPAESVYYEAVVRGEDTEDRPSVVAYALDRKVILVSPNTFYAYLAALIHGLRGLEVDRRAREIINTLSGLRQQVIQFQRVFDIMGRHLDNAGKQYGEASRELARIQEGLEGLMRVGTPTTTSGQHAPPPAMVTEEGRE